MGTYHKGIPLILFLLVFTLILIQPVSSITEKEGFLGTFQRGTDIELLQVCSGDSGLCDSCTLSSVKYPNSTTILSNSGMTKRTNDFNYTLIANHTGTDGTYTVNGHCIEGSTTQVWVYDFEVTFNGNDKPGGGVIVLFSILFLLVVAGLLTLILYNIFHILEWDFDAKDLIWNISAYFILFAIYILGREYLGNSFIDDFLEFVIYTTAFTNVVVPVIAFLISYIKGNLGGGEQ